MRYVGIGLMAISVVCGGFWLGERWTERLSVLQLLRQIVYHLKSQILFANESLPEALREVGERFSDGKFGASAEPGACFVRIAERAGEERGRPFAEIWKEEVLKLEKNSPLLAADLRNLLTLGEQLGFADRKMQERTLLFYLEETDDAIAFLKKEAEDRRKLYRSLGIAAGMFLAVILV